MNIPEGYVLVPLEPTEEMLIAGSDQEWTEDVYTAMIGARPSCYPSDSIEGCYEHALKAMEGEADRLRAASIQAYDEAKERELFESRWGFTNDEQEIYFIPELNCYGSARVNDAANNKSSAWYWWQACAKSRAGIQS